MEVESKLSGSLLPCHAPSDYSEEEILDVPIQPMNSLNAFQRFAIDREL